MELHVRISPLRQRMIDDMTARHFGEKMQKDCIWSVKNLAMFIDVSGRAAREAATVLTQDEVARLLDAAPGAKHKAALSVA